MNSHRPLIAITTYGANDKQEFTLPAQYVNAVRRAGGLAVLVPPGETELSALSQRVQGWILAGGGDLDPTRFQGASHETVYMVDERRDEMELALARLLVDTGMPTLAICRGAQVVNVALGGTLHVHIPDVFGEQVLHRAPPREPTPHTVHVAAGTRLAGLLADGSTSMSWHHQAVDRLGAGLRVAAHAADGVIEAIELPDHPWLLGVQWHPELSAASDRQQQGLFDALVAAIRNM